MSDSQYVLKDLEDALSSPPLVNCTALHCLLARTTLHLVCQHSANFSTHSTHSFTKHERGTLLLAHSWTRFNCGTHDLQTVLFRGSYPGNFWRSLDHPWSSGHPESSRKNARVFTKERHNTICSLDTSPPLMVLDPSSL